MREKNYIVKALEIEEAALRHARDCYDYYNQTGDLEMAGVMKEIEEDERSHVKMLKELLSH